MFWKYSNERIDFRASISSCKVFKSSCGFPVSLDVFICRILESVRAISKSAECFISSFLLIVWNLPTNPNKLSRFFNCSKRSSNDCLAFSKIKLKKDILNAFKASIIGSSLPL